MINLLITLAIGCGIIFLLYLLALNNNGQPMPF